MLSCQKRTTVVLPGPWCSVIPSCWKMHSSLWERWMGKNCCCEQLCFTMTARGKPAPENLQAVNSFSWKRNKGFCPSFLEISFCLIFQSSGILNHWLITTCQLILMKHVLIIQPKKQFMFYWCQLKACVKISAVTGKRWSGIFFFSSTS